MATLEDVLARLDKETLKKFKMMSEVKQEFIPTASMGLNMVIGGGFPRGHQTTLWGNQSAGKSSLLLQTIGMAQKDGLSCGYIDAEKTSNPEWADQLGAQSASIPWSPKSTIADAANVALEWVRAGMDLIVIDSTSILMPGSFFSKTGEMKDFENTGQIGQQARELGQMARMISGENFETAIVLVSQVRMDLGGFMPTQKQSGGKELEHLDALRIKLTSSLSDTKAIKKQVQRGSILVEEAVGRKVKWDINKNKINGRFGSGEYDFYTQVPPFGIDTAGEILDYALRYGIAEKGGAWLTVNGERFQGRDRAVDYIRANPEISEFLVNEIQSNLVVSDAPATDDDDDD